MSDSKNKFFFVAFGRFDVTVPVFRSLVIDVSYSWGEPSKFFPRDDHYFFDPNIVVNVPNYTEKAVGDYETIVEMYGSPYETPGGLPTNSQLHKISMANLISIDSSVIHSCECVNLHSSNIYVTIHT